MKPLVLVEWKDAAGTGAAEWLTHREALEFDLMTILTVGFMVSADEEKVTLAGSYNESDGDNWCEVCVIPTAWIQEVVELTESPPGT